MNTVYFVKLMKKCFSIFVLITFSLTNLSYGDARMDLVAKTIDYLSPLLRTWGATLDENQELNQVMEELIGGLGKEGEDFIAVSDDLRSQFATRYVAVSLQQTWRALVAEEKKRADAQTKGAQKDPAKVAAGYWNSATEGILKRGLIDAVVAKAKESFMAANPQGEAKFELIEAMITEVLDTLLIGIDEATLENADAVIREIDLAAAKFAPTAGRQAVGKPLTPNQATAADRLIREANGRGERKEVRSVDVRYSFNGLDGQFITVNRELTVNVYDDKLADAYNKARIPINTHPGTGGELLKRALQQVHQVSFLWNKLLNTVGIEGRGIWAKHEIAHLDIVTVERLARKYFASKYPATVRAMKDHGIQSIPTELLTDMRNLSAYVNSVITEDHSNLAKALGEGKDSDPVLKDALTSTGVDINNLKIPVMTPDIAQLMVITWAKWNLAGRPVYEAQEEYINHVLKLDFDKEAGEFDVSNIQTEMRQAILERYPEQLALLNRVEYSTGDVQEPVTVGVYASSVTTPEEEIKTVTIYGGDKVGELKGIMGVTEDVYPFKREIKLTQNASGKVRANWILKVFTQEAANAPLLKDVLGQVEKSVVLIADKKPLKLNNRECNYVGVNFEQRTIVIAKGEERDVIKSDEFDKVMDEWRITAADETGVEIRMDYTRTNDEETAYTAFAMFAKNLDELKGQKVDIYLPVEGIGKSDIATAEERDKSDLSVEAAPIVRRLQKMFNEILGDDMVNIHAFDTREPEKTEFKIRPGAKGVIGMPVDKQGDGIKALSEKLGDFSVLPFRAMSEISKGENCNLIEMTATAIMQASLTSDKILDTGNQYAADFCSVIAQIYDKDLTKESERHKLFLFIPHSEFKGIEFDKIKTETKFKWVENALGQLSGWQNDLVRKINDMLGEMKPLIQELRQKFEAIKKTMWSA
ncbi:MAG: hypothetical protein HQL30_08015 [Candidatus Omnitrophica bacterium]|nr:hypothetical protein [Candidatus Omnitrophota bacterium]